MKRGRNAQINTRHDDNTLTWETAQLEALYDIRDRLDRLLGVIGCANAIDIPNILRRIDKNTRKPAKKRKEGRK